MNAARRRICVITTAYNESGCIDELARQLRVLFDSVPQYDFEVIAVDNGSVDDTFERLVEVQRADSRFKILQLSRNFGIDGGLYAGIVLADSDAIVLMSADLQDPPEVVQQFITRWEEGYENVYGIVRERRGTTKLRAFNSALFYWVLGKLADVPIPPNARDFRLLDRAVYEQMQRMSEHNLFLRSLAAWPGFRSIGVPFDQPERFSGRTKSRSIGLGQYAVRAVLANSLAPLALMPIVGAFLVVASALALIALVTYREVAGVPIFRGFATIIATSILLFGILAFLLTLVGAYVGLTYAEVRARPNFVVRKVVDSDVQRPNTPRPGPDEEPR